MSHLPCNSAEFILSAHSFRQLPEAVYPEFAFAGRSNVGKSSLLNSLLGRRGFVKVSGKPGKTQGLNFFLVDGRAHFVDLPGYGFAKVSKTMQQGWQKLITRYLEERQSLECVVVIMDLRHTPKDHDSQLLQWLRQRGISTLPVYTKADKLSGNQRENNARLLDAGHSIRKSDRIIFSSKTGLGVESLKNRLSEMWLQSALGRNDLPQS